MKRLIILCLAVLLLPAGSTPPDEVVEIEILYTSDIHGHVGRDDATFLNPNFPPPLGGGASAAAYIKQVRAKAAVLGREVFLFDSGDLFQGTPVGMKTKGSAVVEWMNDVEYTAGALGNHDFDLGWENTKRLVAMANFPLLGANVRNEETGEQIEWIPENYMIEVEGVKIAILGYCTETTANMSFGKNIEGITFTPIHEDLPKDTQAAREDGADLVFALMHQGLPYKPERDNEYRRMLTRKDNGELPHWGMNAMELAHTVPGVDAIFGGHTHQGYDQPWEDPATHTLVFEPYANGGSIGHITLKIHRETKAILGFDTHADRGALLTLFEEQVWPDEIAAEVIQAKVEIAEEGMDEVVGQTTVLLQRGSPNNALMGFVVADAYRTELEADFALQNTGGVRANISPGNITERDLLTVSPFDNSMVLVEMKGSLLHSLLEDKLSGRGGGVFISGGKVRYDLTRPDGERIVDFSIGGAPWDPEQSYRVAMTNYLAEGNSGMWRLRDEVDPEEFLYTGVRDIDCLRNYVAKQKILSPKNDGRWVRVLGPS